MKVQNLAALEKSRVSKKKRVPDGQEDLSVRSLEAVRLSRNPSSSKNRLLTLSIFFVVRASSPLSPRPPRSAGTSPSAASSASVSTRRILPCLRPTVARCATCVLHLLSLALLAIESAHACPTDIFPSLLLSPLRSPGVQRPGQGQEEARGALFGGVRGFAADAVLSGPRLRRRTVLRR